MLITGGAGYLADQLLPAFAELYDLRLVDVTGKPATTGAPDGE